MSKFLQGSFNERLAETIATDAIEVMRVENYGGWTVLFKRTFPHIHWSKVSPFIKEGMICERFAESKDKADAFEKATRFVRSAVRNYLEQHG